MTDDFMRKHISVPNAAKLGDGWTAFRDLKISLALFSARIVNQIITQKIEGVSRSSKVSYIFHHCYFEEDTVSAAKGYNLNLILI